MLRVRLHCECGESTQVGEGFAGASMECRCGRQIQVPALHQLRELAGLPPVAADPVLMIYDRLARKELPPRTCAGCGERSECLFDCALQCTHTQHATILDHFGGTFSRAIAVANSLDRASVEGEELIIPTPFSTCEACRRAMHLSPPRRWTVIVALILVVAGLIDLLDHPLRGAVVMAAAGIVGLWESWKRRQTAVGARSCLYAIPEYALLLEKYPDAEIVDGCYAQQRPGLSI